jgi:hypothetical protein
MIISQKQKNKIAISIVAIFIISIFIGIIAWAVVHPLSFWITFATLAIIAVLIAIVWAIYTVLNEVL